MIPSLAQQALKDLDGTTCYCGAEKPKGHAFCRPCYFSLPPRLRQDLYKGISAGYAEAYDEAKDFLRIETDRIKK